MLREVKFESQNRRIDHINEVLNSYGIASIEEANRICEEKGIEPERAYKGSFNVRISPELHKKIAVCATEQQISLNSFVENALLASVAAR